MSRNIRTFRDLGSDDQGGDSDDSGAETGGSGGRRQEFYAGSGQAVQGPRGPGGPDAALQRVLSAAQAVRPEDAQQSSGNAEIVTLTLHLWSDGLSIEDGPLMSRQEPETIQFLDQIGRGEIPAELARKYPGKQIDFRIDRKSEPFVAPKVKPFGGQGVRLGNVVPTVVGESSGGSVVQTAKIGEDEAKKHVEDAKKELNVDPAQPTTNIQIRLPDNQRLVAAFNQSHTLETVRTFICTARPDLIYAPFQLIGGYPPKVLENENQSLKEANLLNAVITVKNS